MKVSKEKIFLSAVFFLLSCFAVIIIVFTVMNANRTKTLETKKLKLENQIEVLEKRLEIAEKSQEN